MPPVAAPIHAAARTARPTSRARRPELSSSGHTQTSPHEPPGAERLSRRVAALAGVGAASAALAAAEVASADDPTTEMASEPMTSEMASDAMASDGELEPLPEEDRGRRDGQQRVVHVIDEVLIP
jgi:hypothetical protein